MPYKTLCSAHQFSNKQFFGLHNDFVCYASDELFQCLPWLVPKSEILISQSQLILNHNIFLWVPKFVSFGAEHPTSLPVPFCSWYFLLNKSHPRIWNRKFDSPLGGQRKYISNSEAHGNDVSVTAWVWSKKEPTFKKESWRAYYRRRMGSRTARGEVKGTANATGNDECFLWFETGPSQLRKCAKHISLCPAEALPRQRM